MHRSDTSSHPVHRTRQLAPRPQPPGVSISRDDDHLLVDLAVTWLPYGEPPPEEIWIRFGLNPDQYWSRLCYLLALGSWRRHLGMETGEQIRTLALAHFHPTSQRTRPTPTK
ncbi:MAG: hypothetical protein EOP32_19460 [Rhodococcus sp. (in: high G+C Gram-positive bacteria)]|nr:MAG: hypothetical protein EOP32_19460 [Rhodococcus sp. (in: high G+C Gram-positive bacteria)]